MTATRLMDRGGREVAAVWALLLATAAGILVTYWRLPRDQLYSVGEEGAASGFGRALVFLNYPAALVAIAVAWLAAERIRTRGARIAAAAATVVSAVTAVPGVVDQHDLDAKAINAVPALGVALALGLTIKAAWPRVARLPLDPLRVAIAVVVLVAAIPWIFAVLGFHAPGDLFLGEELRRGGDGRLDDAVHLGDHEGWDGVLLVLASLLLSRLQPPLPVALYLGLMFAYGFAVAFADGWFEQIVKRGWTSWRPPGVLRPELSVEWGVLILAGLALGLALRRLEAPPRRV